MNSPKEDLVTNVMASKESLEKHSLVDLKREVEKDAWIALKQYFDGRSNGSEAKVAGIIIATLTREMQAINNSRQLDILEKRLKLLNG